MILNKGRWWVFAVACMWEITEKEKKTTSGHGHGD